jgi:hypothetical protein
MHDGCARRTAVSIIGGALCSLSYVLFPDCRSFSRKLIAWMSVCDILQVGPCRRTSTRPPLLLAAFSFSLHFALSGVRRGDSDGVRLRRARVPRLTARGARSASQGAFFCVPYFVVDDASGQFVAFWGIFAAMASFLWTTCVGETPALHCRRRHRHTWRV